MTPELKTLNDQIKKVATIFRDKYFKYGEDDFHELEEIHYREEEMSWMYGIWDLFFSISDMYTALYYNVTEDTLIEWYDYCMEQHYKDEPCTNLKNYHLYWPMWYKPTEADLKKSAEAVAKARIALETCIGYDKKLLDNLTK